MANLKQLRNEFQIPNNIIIVNAKLFAAPKPLTRKPQSFTIEDPNASQRDPALNYKSLINTPVYTDIFFEPGSWEDAAGATHFYGDSNSNSPDFLRYNAVLVTVSQTKRIIRTEIQGRDGTVKEYIGQDDYQVTVNGIIDSGVNGRRPLREVLALKKMLDAPVPIHVTCAYLQNLDIHDLVVESWEMGESEGSFSYQPFSISFLSDIPQELTFK